MAFVNSKGDADREQDRAVGGQPIDFDPSDPAVVKVHYDLSAWTFDQRAELSETLADADLPHAWDGEELVVPETVEADVDAMFEKFEEEFGPFPIGLADDDESTEFGLDEWSDADRSTLTDALVDSEIPHRWEGTTVLVAQDAEDAVDDLLDAIEAGELMSADDGDDASAPPDGVLSELFLASNKLAKDPFDAGSRRTLIDLDDQIHPSHPPYAFAPRTWAKAVELVESIVRRIVADADGDQVVDDRDDDTDGSTGVDLDESSDVIGLAQQLRTLLRPYV